MAEGRNQAFGPFPLFYYFFTGLSLQPQPQFVCTAVTFGSFFFWTAIAFSSFLFINLYLPWAPEKFKPSTTLFFAELVTPLPIQLQDTSVSRG